MFFFFLGNFHTGGECELERKIESSIFLCIPRDLNILGKSCTTFVIVKIVRNLSCGRSPCQRVNHVKSGVIYFSAFIFSYDTIHVSGTIHTWNRDLTLADIIDKESEDMQRTWRGSSRDDEVGCMVPAK